MLDGRSSWMRAAALGLGVTVAAPATAAEPLRARISGFMEQWVGWAEQDFPGATDYNTVDAQQESEVRFAATTTLDNGIDVEVAIDLESDGGGNFGIDESFLELESLRFGTLRLGRTKGVLRRKHVLAPDVGIDNTDGDYASWIVVPSGFTDISQPFFNASGLSNKINYESPLIHGIQVVAAHAPGAGGNSLGQPAKVRGGASTFRTWEAGLVFLQDIGELEVAGDLGLGRATRSDTQQGRDMAQAGLRLTWNQWTLGGGYARILEDNYAAATSSDGYAFDVGVSHRFEHAALSLTWFRSVAEGQHAVPGQDTKDSVMLSGAYELGPGITAKGSLVRAAYEDEAGVAANENDGWALVGGFALGF